MKYLILTLTLLISGCSTGTDCDPGSAPGPPLGAPDDKSTYSGSDGYESITYTYYCHGGQYKSYTYIRVDGCSDYELDSTYESDGICKIK